MNYIPRGGGGGLCISQIITYMWWSGEGWSGTFYNLKNIHKNCHVECQIVILQINIRLLFVCEGSGTAKPPIGILQCKFIFVITCHDKTFQILWVFVNILDPPLFQCQPPPPPHLNVQGFDISAEDGLNGHLDMNVDIDKTRREKNGRLWFEWTLSVS